MIQDICKPLLYSFTQLMYIIYITLVDSSVNNSDMHLGLERPSLSKVTLLILVNLFDIKTEDKASVEVSLISFCSLQSPTVNWGWVPSGL